MVMYFERHYHCTINLLLEDHKEFFRFEIVTRIAVAFDKTFSCMNLFAKPGRQVSLGFVTEGEKSVNA